MFFTKLLLERTLRDTIHRHVLETYDEFTELERKERIVQTLDEENLAAELQREYPPETADDVQQRA